MSAKSPNTDHTADGVSLAGLTREWVAEVCERRGVAYLAAFGSVARGDAGPESDFDVMVEWDQVKETTPWAWLGLIDDLSARTGRRVDLVPTSVLENRFRRRAILQDLRVIYDRR